VYHSKRVNKNILRWKLHLNLQKLDQFFDLFHPIATFFLSLFLVSKLYRIDSSGSCWRIGSVRLGPRSLALEPWSLVLGSWLPNKGIRATGSDLVSFLSHSFRCPLVFGFWELFQTISRQKNNGNKWMRRTERANKVQDKAGNLQIVFAANEFEFYTRRRPCEIQVCI